MLKKILTRTLLLLILSGLFILFFFFPSSVSANSDKYQCNIIDDGVMQMYFSSKDEPMSFVYENNINLAENDKLDISHYDEEKVIYIDRCKTLYINYNDEVASYNVYEDTLEKALDEIRYDLTNKIVLSDLDIHLEDGFVAEIKDLVNVNFINDGNKTNLTICSGNTIEQFLIDNSIEYTSDDYLNYDVNYLIQNGDEIVYKKAVTKIVTTTEKVAFKTTTEYDSSLAAGTKKIETAGVSGEKEVTSKIISYYDDEIVSSDIINEAITKEATNEVIKVGTKINSSSRSSYNGISVGDTVTGSKSHYCACSSCGTGSGITASGLKVYNGMSNPYIVACNWLPLGAVIDVDGVVYTVADTGGSGLSTIGRIDIFVPEGHQACYAKGVGSCNITILSL